MAVGPRVRIRGGRCSLPVGVAGTLTVPISYLTARTLANRRAALVTAALVACNPFLLWYSQEARSYALFAALSAAALWMFLQALQRQRRRELWWWAVLSALALATHYFATFLIAPQAVFLVATARPGARAAAIKASALPAAAALALAPLALVQRSPQKYPFTRLESLGTRTLQIPQQMLVGLGLPAQTAWLLPLAALSVTGAWLVARRVSANRRTMLAIVSTVGAAFIVPVLLAFGGLDLVLSRNFIAILVPCLTLAGAGFALSRAGLLACAAVCVAWLGAAALVDSQQAWQRPPWQSVAAALGRADGTRLVLTIPASLGADPLDLYLRRAQQPSAKDVLHVNEIDVVGMFAAGSALATQITQLAPPAPGFRRIAERESSAYVLLRYVRRAPLLDSLAHPILLRAGMPPARIGASLCCGVLVQPPER